MSVHRRSGVKHPLYTRRSTPSSPVIELRSSPERLAIIVNTWHGEGDGQLEELSIGNFC